MKRLVRLLVAFCILGACTALMTSFGGSRAASAGLVYPTPTWPTPTPTQIHCPVPTSESPPRVEPVTSPTDGQTQTIIIGPGNFDGAWVASESGIFYGTNAITINLLPGVAHHLTVTTHIRVRYAGVCKYGGYNTSTTADRLGNPLVIKQSSDPVPTQQCPVATPELGPQVDSVYSPSNQYTQIIHISPGRYDQAWVESEAGTFYGLNDIQIWLRQNTMNHLRVTIHVPPVTSYDGCQYGNYTLSTIYDRHGDPLNIAQAYDPHPELRLKLFVPLANYRRTKD
jgi:hypothetical protein